jgi:threonyl-tRNA synthetase
MSKEMKCVIVTIEDDFGKRFEYSYVCENQEDAVKILKERQADAYGFVGARIIDAEKAEPKRKHTYDVSLYFHQCVVVRVEANSEEEAIKIAENTSWSSKNVSQLGWEQDGAPDVEEIKFDGK